MAALSKVFWLLCWLFEVFWWLLCKFFKRVCKFRSSKKPNFSRDTVLITGAAQGLGKELALQFSECGATVVLWDINETKLRQTCSEITAQGREAFGYTVDVAKREQVYETAERVREEVGNISILVNNASVLLPKTFLDMKDSEIESIININVLGCCWTIRAFLDSMMEANNGHIINISSSTAIHGAPKATVYSASKAAILGLTYALNKEILLMSNQRNVTFTLVCPGRIEDTGQGMLQLHPWPNDSGTGLQVDYVADKILQGVLEKTFLLDIPRSRWDAILRFVLPQHLLDKLFLIQHYDDFKNAKKSY